MLALHLPPGDLTVVAVGAHPDDVEIGCGGTLMLLCANRTVTAHVVVMTGTPKRHNEAADSASRFLSEADTLTMHLFDLPDGRLPGHWNEVKQSLESLKSIAPDVVLAPRRDDAHQDHRLLATLAPTVWRDSLVLRFEIPKWDGDRGSVNCYVPLTQEVAHRKAHLLDECYPSQVGRDWWDSETFLGSMRLRGMEVRHRYAEGFLVDKSTLAF